MKKKLKEFSSAGGRPDSSGNRGGSFVNKTYQKGGTNYPYDKASGSPTYGTPLAYDRGSAGSGGSRQNVNTPKNVDVNDDRWSSDISDLDEQQWQSATPTRGNIVDNPRMNSKFGEEVDEAIGVPYNSAKAGSGTGGSGGGRTMPGTSGEWSNRPKGGHWDRKMSDKKLSKAAKLEHGYGNVIKTTDHYEDESVPQAPVYDVELGNLATILKTAGSGFGATSKAYKQARMMPGMGVREAFVSLKDTSSGCLDNSMSVADMDSDINNSSFITVHNKSKESFLDLDDFEMVKTLMDVDQDYFGKFLAKIGKSELSGIYDAWASNALQSDDIDIEEMSDRVLNVYSIGDDK